MEKKIDKFMLEDRLIDFSVIVIKVVQGLPDDKVGSHLGGQLLRSACSPALQYGEALGAESKRDFAHKLGILLKELRESLNCMKILNRIGYIEEDSIAVKECNELVSIFVKSVETTKRNLELSKSSSIKRS